MADETIYTSADNRDEIGAMYHSVKTAKFTGNDIQNGVNEIVDILRDYPWASRNLKTNVAAANPSFYGGTAFNNSAVVSTHNISHNFPYCYCIEREQVISSTFMNIVTSFAQLSDAMATLDDITKLDFFSDLWSKSVSLLGQGVNFVGENIFDSTKDNINKLYNKVRNGSTFNNEFLSESKLLHPYRYTYATSQTGKFFVFPMLTDADILSVRSSWGTETENAEGGAFLNKLLNSGLGAAVTKASGFMLGFDNLMNITRVSDGYNANRSFHIDQGKFYQYPTEGDDITVQFPLYNTSVKGAWKQNFRFLFLFAARNLPAKLSISEYRVPLLYDVIIPGYKRLPLCYVSNITSRPMGIIRTMRCSDILNANGAEWSVAIPECWEVSITFKCLIPPTMNLMLSAMADNKITVTSSNTASAAKVEANENQKAENSTSNF